MAKSPTHIEIVNTIMEYSEQGFIMHAFVIEALRQYSTAVVHARKVTIVDDLCTPEDWINCAQEALEHLEFHFGAYHRGEKDDHP